MSAGGSPNGTTADVPIRIDSLQRSVLGPQLEAFLEAAREPQSRALYAELRDSIDRMEVAPHLAERLGAILEVVLSSRRVRKAFGPAAEASLSSLFRQTPQGREVAASIGSVNTALERISGQTLEQASAALRRPGVYALTLKTSGCQIVIRFEQSGVQVESLDVELG